MDKEAARIEHLKAIQQVIERLTRSSFAIKAVASTITAATVAAIAVTSTPIVGLGGLSLLSLWGIDAFYLSRERRFRSLFDRVRIGPAPEFGDQTFFTMATWGDGESMFKVAVSPTLVALYIPLMLVVGGTALVVAAF